MAPTRTGLGIVSTFELPIIPDDRGSLTFIEGERHVPFSIERVYYVYDVPVNSRRGGHAHAELEQVLIAVSGSLDVIVDDGASRQTFGLSKPAQGLYIGPMVWREMENFSRGAVCLVIASRLFEESDYFRDYDVFTRALADRS